MKRIFSSLIFASLFAFSASAQTGVNTAIVPTPRTFPTNWMSRHTEYVAQAKQGGVDLLFVGDSIMDGWRWGKGGIEIWKNYYLPHHTADFGIGYDRTQNVLWRLQNGELDGIKPRAVVLLIGTNNLGNEDDGKPRNSTDETVAGITAIVNEIRTRLPDAKLLLLGIFPRGTVSDPARVQVKEVNAQISKLANGQSIQYMDLGDKFLAPDGTLSRDIMPDLLHPSQKGYQIWQDAMQGTLENIMK